MTNEFSKEERIAFEDILEGFNDALVLSRAVSIHRAEGQMMERANNVIWRPQPYIAQSFDGTDQTGNFKDQTQLSVPATLGYQKSVPLMLSSTELRDQLQEKRLGQAAFQKLASDINVSVNAVAAQQGTLVVKRTTAAAGFDDVAQIEQIMNEQGVQSYGRKLALSTRDYNGMAGNLANRETIGDMSKEAYRRAYVGLIASFDTFKLDYAENLAAAAGSSITIDTQAAATNYYTPVSTSVSATGEQSNVDNRYQTITVSSTTSVAAGDAFTIAGVNAVHHITKGDTGNLKTFRVISVDSSTTMTVSPPIISNQGSTDAEAQYQNVAVTPSATAAITFLNTVAGPVNPFWQEGSIELLPGTYVDDANAGAAVMKAATDQGIEVCMTKQYDIDIKKYKYRWDVFYGVVNLQPEMNGIIIFSQT